MNNNLKQTLAKLVDQKLGKVITKDLKNMIKEHDTYFNIDAYVNELFNKYYTESEIRNLKTQILKTKIPESKSFSDQENFTECDFHESLDFDSHEFHVLSPEEIVRNLHHKSKKIQLKCLSELELCVEDLINQPCWSVLQKFLQNFLKENNDKEIMNLTLKIFQRLLFTSNKSQMTCEVFISFTEIILYHVQLVNSINQHNTCKDIVCEKDKWLNVEMLPIEASENTVEIHKKFNSEVLLKSVSLLLDCQKQVPDKWIRFNVKRLRKIVCSFVHLLSSTTSAEHEKLTGLELISILNPKGDWCRYWCHTATGRSLLCSALRKYKNFFVYLIEIILVTIKKRKFRYLQSFENDTLKKISPRYNTLKRVVSDNYRINSDDDCENYNGNGRIKHSRSAPTYQSEKSQRKITSQKSNEKFFIENIPRKVAEEATFCHSLSVIVVLIQFRSGRALFPVHTGSKNRLLSIQDFISLLIDYLEEFEYAEREINKVICTPAYKYYMLNIMKTLKDLQSTSKITSKSAQKF